MDEQTRRMLEIKPPIEQTELRDGLDKMVSDPYSTIMANTGYSRREFTTISHPVSDPPPPEPYRTTAHVGRPIPGIGKGVA